MKATNSYLAKIRNNMTGWNNASGTKNFRNMQGRQLQNSPGMVGQRTPNWNANGSSNAMPNAQPMIIQVSNASAAAVSNFDIFGAAQYLTGNYGGGTWSNNGNFTLNGVTISSLFAGVSYQQILSSTQNNPFTAGGVYLESVTGSTQQVADVYNLTSQSPDGQLYTMPIKPYKDAYQFQNGITYNTASFNMGSLTKLSWQTIYASAVFQVSIFPAQIIDPSNALNGSNVSQNFGRPNVVGSLRGGGR